MPPAATNPANYHDDDEHVDDVELAPMSGAPSHPIGGGHDNGDDESTASAESEFSNDEGEDNQYKPGAVGRAGLRVMDQQLEEQRRRKNTFCLALLMLALGVALLKFINGGDGPASPTKGLPQPTSDADADDNNSNNDDNSGLFGPGRKIKFSPFGEVIDGMDVVDKFYSGYGEGSPKGSGPSQSKMEEFGGDYVDKEFPLLSFFTKVEFVE